MRNLGKVVLLSSILACVTANQLLAGGERDEPNSTPAHKANRSQTTCPVMGGPIDKSLYVDVKGKRIYLCCAACEDAVRAEPDKYIQKIERRGESVDDVPAQGKSSPP